MKLKRCVYGGSHKCERQGGSGSRYHSSTYVHPFPAVDELGVSLEKSTKLESKGSVVVQGLTSFFDEDVSKAILNLQFSNDSVYDSIKKSLYDIDVESREGVLKLMELLPVLDHEILQDIAKEIWIGYMGDNISPDMLRIQIKGYLMDYLSELDENDEQSE